MENVALIGLLVLIFSGGYFKVLKKLINRSSLLISLIITNYNTLVSELT